MERSGSTKVPLSSLRTRCPVPEIPHHSPADSSRPAAYASANVNTLICFGQTQLRIRARKASRNRFSVSGCRISAKSRTNKKASHRKNDGSPRNGMVGHTGFEPVTSGSGDQRSIQTELMPPGLMKLIRPFCGDLFCGASCACESQSCGVFVFFRRASNAPPCEAIGVVARVQPACSRERPARSSREGLNTGAGRSGIFTTSPVLGFRPIRGARVTTLKVPNPRISMCSPCFNAATTESRKPSTTVAVSDFGNPVASAI